ncbi:unnamed protein product [Discula destructiva]
MQSKSIVTVFLLAVPAVFALPAEADPRASLNSNCLDGLCEKSLNIMRQWNGKGYVQCMKGCSAITIAKEKTKCEACCDKFKQTGQEWRDELKKVKTAKKC